jgi:4-hydroxy-3-methylbut-2-enyl diphosphate reductase
MQIITASPRGFCAGVKRALDILENEVAKDSGTVYVLNEIVHNKTVVERFKQQNVIFVKSVDEVPNYSVLVFSAHGISPQVRELAKQKHLEVIDATCPLVNKVHLEAVRYAKDNYIILLIGHKGHEELVGTYEEAKQWTDYVVVIESGGDESQIGQVVAQINELQKNAQSNGENTKKLICLTQTTLSVSETSFIIQELKKKLRHAEFCHSTVLETPKKSDICFATTNRQNAVSILVEEELDLMIVVGSMNSSNTRRLYELSKMSTVPTVQVDNLAQLLELSGDKPISAVLEQKSSATSSKHGQVRVGITSGASVPEDLVEEIVDYLRSHFGAEVIEQVSGIEESISFWLLVGGALNFLQQIDSIMRCLLLRADGSASCKMC